MYVKSGLYFDVVWVLEIVGLGCLIVVLVTEHIITVQQLVVVKLVTKLIQLEILSSCKDSDHPSLLCIRFLILFSHLRLFITIVIVARRHERVVGLH